MSRKYRWIPGHSIQSLPVSKDEKEFEESKIEHTRSDSIIQIRLRDGSRIEAWPKEDGSVRVERVSINHVWDGSAAILLKQFVQILDSKHLKAHLDPKIIRGNVPKNLLKFLKKFGFVEQAGSTGLTRTPEPGDCSNL